MIRKERIWEDMKQSRETRVEDEPRLNEQVARGVWCRLESEVTG